MKCLLSATACVFLLAACSDSGDGFVAAEPSEEGIVSANPIEASQTNEQPPPAGMATIAAQNPTAAAAETPSTPAASPVAMSPVDGVSAAPVNAPAGGVNSASEPATAVPPAVEGAPANPSTVDTPAVDTPAVAPRVAPPAGDSAYPAGPYGVGDPEVGEVIEDLPLRGYFNLDPTVESEETELEDGALGQLRAGGMTHAAVLTAKGWCGICRGIARSIGDELQPRVAQAAGNGGMFIQMLLTGNGSDAPSDLELSAWAQATGLTTLLLGPADERTSVVFQQRQVGYVIELATMRIVHRQYVNSSSAPQLLDKLEEFLQ